MDDSNSSSEKYWGQSWARHLRDYLAAPARCGMWLDSRFDLRGLSTLECAGGSCRDSRYLFNRGYACAGSDFDQKTLDYVKTHFPSSDFDMSRQDAFALDCRDGQFDVVFHNGFWGYFDDEAIHRLLREQVRVARKYAVALVHNAENPALADRFARKSRQDDLYKIRFFSRDDMLRVVQGSGIRYKSLRLEKFGGPADLLFGLSRRMPALLPLTARLVPRLYRWQRWSTAERVAVVIAL